MKQHIYIYTFYEEVIHIIEITFFTFTPLHYHEEVCCQILFPSAKMSNRVVFLFANTYEMLYIEMRIRFIHKITYVIQIEKYFIYTKAYANDLTTLCHKCVAVQAHNTYTNIKYVKT